MCTIHYDRHTVKPSRSSRFFQFQRVSIPSIHQFYLIIPLASKEYADKTNFRKFRRQIFHTSLVHILSVLRPHMKTPRITRCCDGHLCCVIYGLGPYIADYPEQALLAGIVQGWCPMYVFFFWLPLFENRN